MRRIRRRGDAMFPSKMASAWVVVLFSAVAAELYFPAQWDSAKANRTLQFHIFSSKNQTGHEMVHFELGKSSPEMTNDWMVRLQHQTLNYGGVVTSHIHVSLSVPPARPDDYELFPGIGSYKFHHDDRATFDEALITCAQEGGHLMIINSEEESKVAQILFSRHRNAGPWAFVGFHDRLREGEYTTIFGEPLKDTGFANWSSADPNNYGGDENCGSVLPNGLLGDIRCDDSLAFFCEFDLAWLDP